MQSLRGLKMINNLKVYLYAGLAFISAVIVGYIKYLRTSNENKDKEISTLNNNINTQNEIHKDDIKRTEFEAKQVQKVESVNDETNLNKLDEERNKNEVNNPDFVNVTI